MCSYTLGKRGILVSTDSVSTVVFKLFRLGAKLGAARLQGRTWDATDDISARSPSAVMLSYSAQDDGGFGGSTSGIRRSLMSPDPPSPQHTQPVLISREMHRPPHKTHARHAQSYKPFLSLLNIACK